MSRAEIPEDFLSLERVGELLDASIAEILRHEDGGRYLDWIRANAHRFFGDLPGAGPAEEVALAVGLGRSIWNATPLPRNRFRPQPLPEPGRNDPCPCGSGRKYKQCCATLPRLETVDPEEVWPVLVDHLGREQLEQAVRLHQIPALALAGVAQKHLEEGEAKKAASLLAPLFEGPVARLDERFEPALDVLCDAYLRLGHDRKRRALVERIAGEAHGALKRTAWQRIALIRLDGGEADAAWDAMREAQQADPGDPSLALTEVLLLMSQKRTAEAGARAKFWAAKLRKEGYPDEELIGSLEDMARDPTTAFADMFSQSVGVDLAPLRNWVERARVRPIPLYAVGPLPVLDPSDPDAMRATLREHFASLGMAAAELDQMAEQLSKDLLRQVRNEERKARRRATRGQVELIEAEASAAEPQAEPERLVLVPEELEQIESQWHAVFPSGKPLTTGRIVDDGTDPWAAEEQRDWLAFLERHPEAADSLDILDDLVSALLRVELAMPQGAHGGLAAELAQRGRQILEAAVEGRAVELPWRVPQNRPGLRLLARCVDLRMDRGDAGEAMELAGTLLRLNPTDNHGFRGLLVTHLLRNADAGGALALIARYPDDGLCDMRYAEVLARLGQGDEPAALQALTAALQVNAHVPRFLARGDAKSPRRGPPEWVTYGSPDEARDYCVQARDAWEATPGALEWLPKAVRLLRKASSGGAARTQRSPRKR